MAQTETDTTENVIQLTDEQRLQWTKEDLIRSIRSDSRQMQRKLQSIQKDATEALRMMSEGHMVYGAGTAAGPFSTQAVADVAMAATRRGKGAAPAPARATARSGLPRTGRKRRRSGRRG